MLTLNVTFVLYKETFQLFSVGNLTDTKTDIFNLRELLLRSLLREELL